MEPWVNNIPTTDVTWNMAIRTDFLIKCVITIEFYDRIISIISSGKHFQSYRKVSAQMVRLWIAELFRQSAVPFRWNSLLVTIFPNFKNVFDEHFHGSGKTRILQSKKKNQWVSRHPKKVPLLAGSPTNQARSSWLNPKCLYQKEGNARDVDFLFIIAVLMSSPKSVYFSSNRLISCSLRFRSFRTSDP